MASTGAATAMGWRRNVIGPSGERLRVHGSWCSLVAYRFQMILSWTMMAPKELGRLLMGKRPEVSVMLGYYALLMDLRSGMWQVGDAGRYVLGLVVRESLHLLSF